MVKSEYTMEKKPIEAHVKISEPLITVPNPRAMQREHSVAKVTNSNVHGQSKYALLLNVIEELGRDIRPAYASSRSSVERVKRGLNTARSLVKECLAETERSARQ